MNRRNWHRLVALGLALAWATPLARAHDGRDDDGHHHEHGAASKAPAARYPEGLILPKIAGPKPWSDAPHLNDPKRFHIAIMTDRTGGHRPGIWMKGVERVNLLRPEFVMSVGDLIEGYSGDAQKVEAEWAEFLGFIDRMEMKFFFVPGNHDLKDAAMHRIWREHFGPEWYSFDYKGVHFVALNSEDPSDHLGDEQLAWLDRDLAEHADARWTLLFLHKPLWTYAERNRNAGNPDTTNWKKVEAMLGSRPHTVFAGHVHNYTQYDRNGMRYYHLATTGASSQLRGIPYGEFDHVTWLTMEADGPRVTHLLLDGVLAPDVVTERSIGRFREFLTKTSLEVAPILIAEKGGFSEGSIDLRLANTFDSPVTITGRIEGLPLRGLTVNPAKLEMSAEPGQTAHLAVRVQFGEEIPFDRLAGTVFTATIRSPGATGDAPLKAEQTLPVVIDRGFACPKTQKAVTLDGRLDEWADLANTRSSQPVVLGAVDAWGGKEDADLTFDVAHDDEFIYVAARVRDDVVRPGEDRLEILWDARPIGRRLADPRLRRFAHWFHVPAPSAEETSTMLEVSRQGNQPTIRGAAAATRRIDGGYAIELAIPTRALAEAYEGAE
jgi:hypothetical protein